MAKSIQLTLVALVLTIISNAANATCSWTTLSNGSVANADQVMNNLGCLAPISAPALIGAVSISPSASFQPSSLKLQRGVMGTLASDQGGIVYQHNGGTSGVNEAMVFDIGSAGNDYRLKIAGTDRLVITGANGFVGIGVTTPPKLLTVGTDTSCTTIGVCDPLRIAGQATGNTVGARLEIGFNYAKESTRNNFATVGYVTTDTTAFAKGDLYFTTRSVTTDTAPSERMRITSAGNVGIGMTSPGQKLDVAGTIRQSNCTTAGTLSTNASGDIICTSDARLKNILGDYVDGLNVITQITPRRFTYKPTASDPVEKFVHAGFIAQDIKRVIPQAVALQHSGYYSLDTTAVLAASVNAIKELKVENDLQAAEIRRLHSQNAAAFGLLKQQAAEIQDARNRLSARERRTAIHTAENISVTHH